MKGRTQVTGKCAKKEDKWVQKTLPLHLTLVNHVAQFASFNKETSFLSLENSFFPQNIEFSNFPEVLGLK